MNVSSQPTYAVQLMRPILRALRRTPGFPTHFIVQLEQSDPTSRIPVETAQRLFAGAVELTGDVDLGLRAARESLVGDYEVVEYVAASAPTWRAALEAIFRFCHLVDGSARYRLDEFDGRAAIVLENTVQLPRHARDYQVAAMFVASSRWVPPAPGRVEVCFAHPAPDDLSGYRATFGDYSIHFDRGFDGFAFDAALLDQPLPRADPSLHKLLRRHAERMLEELEPHEDLLLRQVRADILETMRDGSVSVETTARHLRLSRRTLARRLRELGTSFSDLLEDTRRAMARSYLERTQHTVEEIAYLLGYSSAAPFVRAFRRWTGSSPIEYRRAAAH